MLVHVSQAFVFGRLGERPVLYIDLDRREGNAVVLDHDYLEAVRENLALNDLLELCSLPPYPHWEDRGNEEHKSSAATQDTFSFGHVRF